jgi:hypothetical protein
VKELPNVVVKQVPVMISSGDVVLVPGPWSLHTRSRTASAEADSAVPTGGEKRPSFDDDEDDESMRASSNANAAALNQDRFVVRNEFGHARLQPLLELIDAQWDDSERDAVLNPRIADVGGHCVLPPDFFEECLDKGWGTKHPLAGRYHPITGTVVPSTTLVYFAPRDERELDLIWSIICKSYDWAKAGW